MSPTRNLRRLSGVRSLLDTLLLPSMSAYDASEGRGDITVYEGGEGVKEKFQGRVARPDEAHLSRVSLECLRCTIMCVEGIRRARLVEDEQIESCDWREN